MKKVVYILAVLLLLVSACKSQEVQPSQGINLEITPEEGGEAPAAAAETPQTEPQETLGEEAQTTETAAPASESTPQAPVNIEEGTCSETASMGFMSCVPAANGDLTVTMKNVGRGDLEGVVYRFYDENSMMIGESQETFSLGIGEEKGLSVPLSQNDETYKISIYPVQGGKICSNKQNVVIPTTNCR